MRIEVKYVESLFFFSSRRRHTRLQGDWSSDVCSSDLYAPSENRYFFTKNFWSSILSEIVSHTHIGAVIHVLKFHIPQVVRC